jgi:hypothetical protein
LQHKLCELLAVQRFDQISAACPAKIEGTFDLPKVSELIMANGRENVELYVRFELIRLADLINVGGNLTTPQVNFIASELVSLFPNETIADFKLCFQRGARGEYGDIYRMDGIVIRGWMEKYLEEKYQVLENNLMKEKDDLYKPVIIPNQDELTKKYLDILEKELRPDGKKIEPLTDLQIKREGQERPKSIEYNPPDGKYLVTNEKIKAICLKMYSGLTFGQMSEFKKYCVEGYYIFCESKEKAEEIYIEAIK